MAAFVPAKDIDSGVDQEGRLTMPGETGRLASLGLAQLPTPLEDAPRLSAALGGPRIMFKRDDLTGVGLGGNKVRKLDYIIARAINEGADTLVVCGGFQSNLARIAAAMANRVGLKVELVLGGVPGEVCEQTGNLLLDGLLGARVTLVDTVPRWEFGDSMERVAASVRARGGKPFIMPLGGSGPEGMTGYIQATVEMEKQLSARGIRPDRLIVGIGSGGTYSGLVLGAMNTSVGYTVTGISVSRTREFLLEKIPEAAGHAADLLGLAHRPRAEDLDINDQYIGQSYGALTPDCVAAIRLVAQTEGVLLDPVYSGKAMAGLIGLIKRGIVGKDETVVFLHTGGQPALFAFPPAALLPDGNAPVAHFTLQGL